MCSLRILGVELDGAIPADQIKVDTGTGAHRRCNHRGDLRAGEWGEWGKHRTTRGKIWPFSISAAKMHLKRAM